MPSIYVLVLIPGDVQEADIAGYTQSLFIPFMRDLGIFPPYERVCNCIDSDGECVQTANKSVGHFHVFWRSYNRLPESQRPEWREYLKPWIKAVLNAQADTKEDTPDPECELCTGTGIRTVTRYDPNMYDNWWDIDTAGEVIGPVSQIKEVLIPRNSGHFRYQVAGPNHKPFDFYHVVTPDGQPYRRWDYDTEQAWLEACRNVFHQWKPCIVVRCLVHA